MIKTPIVLLERCDKIWETLQLIKTVQIEKPVALTDNCDKNEKEKEEEKPQDLDKVKPSPLFTKRQLRKSDNTVPPFKFSVQKTRKLYPCATCDRQYLERRSLRKHSERVHGVVLPLLIQRKRWKRSALKKKNETTSVASIDKESNRSEKLYDNKDSCEKITTRTRSSSTATTSSTTLTQYVKCTLCQQKVTSLRKHLINYHKIGGSSSVVKQLESSLLSETTSSENERILTNESYQDGYRIMDNAREKPQVKEQTSYTLSHANARKKLKLSNKHNAFIQNPTATTQRQISSGSYKCNICLGMYSSTHSLYKHKRIHKLRGETKENFHKFKCRYFNSPFNKRNKLMVEAKSSKISADVAKNTNQKVNEKNSLQLNNFKHDTSINQTSKINRVTRYSERIKRNNETSCICGRSFRNPHTLFIHKKSCELCQIEDISAQNTRVSSDRDSGIGINITIKKRNDSYEIVGKDDEDKPQTSETTNLQEDTLSISHTPNCKTKHFIKTSTKQQVPDTCVSKYSKNHSILKLQEADEDEIIDIEDDVQISPNEDNTTKQVITQEDDKQNSSEQHNDEKTEKVFDKVATLKQMCKEVLKVLEMRKSENIENKNKKYNQEIKDQETCKENSQVKTQEIHQENKRKLRPKRQYSTVELDHSYNGKKVAIAQFDPLKCGYCKEQFSTIKSYDSHLCTVKYGKSFDKFSLQLQCFCCKEVLNNNTEFDEHVRSKHFEFGVYHCYHCPERFTTDRARLHHFHTEHNDLICRFCNKRLTISAKTFHEAYHFGFGYPCHKCKKAYTNSKSLSYHKHKIHSKWADNLMTCTICLKSVKVKTFRRHMATHKHNACHFCGKMFSDRVGIEYHTMMHHGTNAKLKCNICGTRFHTKKQLEMHEKIDGCNSGMHKMKRKLQ